MISSPHITREVMNEYETRILQAFDYLEADEVYDLIDRNEPVDVIFGSSGYTVDLQNPLSHESSTIFLKGYCTLFAHTYATTHGASEILLITNKDDSMQGWSGHMVASRIDADGNREWVDFRGVVREANLEREYPLTHYSHQVMELSEGVALTMGEEYREEPLGFLDSLEAAFVRMVVDEVHRQITR